ncbi:uncharacterized protein LOC129724288 isoform X2 [Wyeomyia smithii]|uniref:uncharacterized protein LOC129724288 isoform X2 n=1 Tax=Wyeomyia smithii TaxID=174621 RepID=UPI0024680658|nr:uncharacterized protein LOC129724288 isoform X2 [Wyeomyia smithii]
MCDILVPNMNCNRKRMRSDDDCGVALQRKMFIDQHRMDQQDENKMKRIQEKTINMLFQGAKISHQQAPGTCAGACLRHVRLLGGGETDFDFHQCPSWIEKKPDRKCRICDRLSMVHADCVNCNLELCEYCGFSCSYCPEKICMNCVNLFNCQNSDVPCCERCKIFN